MSVWSRALAAISKPFAKDLAPVDPGRGGWFPIVREPYSGAWQNNEEWVLDSVLSYPAVFACITQISNDIGKLRAKLVSKDSQGIWEETDSPAFSPVLRLPNRYQNHIQFKQNWIVSKLLHGNTYALVERDARNVVVAQYLLDPKRVKVLVSEDGAVFYELTQDNLSGLTEESVIVPASEIIHDRTNCLFHPLVGISPLFASGAAATMGLKMETDSLSFFGNSSSPGGVLSAPGAISDETAGRLKTHWEANYTGKNAGRVAVLGDGLQFIPMKMTAVDSQHIQRSEAIDKLICSAFHVPPYVVGLGELPGGMKPGDLKQVYYDNCLHILIEEFELCQDLGLTLPSGYGVELDTDTLLRMDQATLVDTLVKAVKGGVMRPNTALKRQNLAPIKGGDTIYMQQQDFAIEALYERDQNDPFSKPTASVAPATPVAQSTENSDNMAADAEAEAKALIQYVQKRLANA